jgi:hypothetical protein
MSWPYHDYDRTDDRDHRRPPLWWTEERERERKPFLVSLPWLLVMLLCGLLFWSILPSKQLPYTLAYSDFINDVKRGQVSDVVIQGRDVSGHFTDSRPFRTYMVDDPSIWQQLNGNGIRVTAMPEDKPPDVIAWFEARSVWLQVMLVVVALAFVWFLTLAVMWAVTPRRLVTLYDSLPGPKMIDQITEAADKRSGGLAKLLRAIGEAALLLLGTSRRARAAWIAHYAPEARAQFARLKVVHDRRIAVDLPVILDGTHVEQAWPVLEALFRKPALALLISGPGGAGKTTLACRIGSRAAGVEGKGLGGAISLPLLIDRDLDAEATGDEFIAFLSGQLRASIGAPRVSTALTEALLRSGDVLVIVDGLSERSDATRRAFDPARPGFPIMRLIATSREAECSGMSAVLETVAVPPDALYGFIDSYLAAIARESGTEKPNDAEIYEACAQLKRLLRDRPTTPMFAAMWAEEVGRVGQRAAMRIQGVAELIDAYVDNLLAPASGRNAERLDNLRLDLVAIAVRELGNELRPGWLMRTQVLDALRDRGMEDTDKRIYVLLDSRLIEADSHNTELMRLALDPVAEHLVARGYVEDLAGKAQRWSAFRTKLENLHGVEGFRDSLWACLEHPVYGRPVPHWVREWLTNVNETARSKHAVARSAG